MAAAKASWRARHADEMAAYMSEYRTLNNDRLNAYQHTYDSSPAGLDRARRNNAKQRQNRTRATAYLAVHLALRSGRLRKEPCLMCGRLPVHAHHPRGYDNALDVEWLCPWHHREAHGLTNHQPVPA